MIDPAQLAALAAIHRRGSFDLAASALNVTPSAVSQRLRALEDHMGCLLIRREKPCQATPAGLRLIRHFDELCLMEHSLSEDLPGLSFARQSLRIALNADSLATWVMPALAQTPDRLFDLVIDDQAFSQDWLRRGEVFGAITAHPGPLQGCETLPLGALRYRATARPDFIARHFANGISVSALMAAPSLRFNDKDLLQEDWARAHCPKMPQRFSLPAHLIASSEAFVSAALAGMGWGMNPEVLVADHIAEGRLAELIPGAVLDVALYWQYTRLAAKSLEPLTKALRKAAARALVQH